VRAEIQDLEASLLEALEERLLERDPAVIAGEDDRLTHALLRRRRAAAGSPTRKGSGGA